MPFMSLRAPRLKPIERIPRSRGLALRLGLFCAAVLGMLTLAGFAQVNQPASGPLTSLINPEAHPMPDANDRMIMREENARKQNFDAANAERLKQMMKATDMLETMASALKAEVDKSGDVTQNTINKAEAIEKLARIVRQRMTLTVGPN